MPQAQHRPHHFSASFPPLCRMNDTKLSSPARVSPPSSTLISLTANSPHHFHSWHVSQMEHGPLVFPLIRSPQRLSLSVSGSSILLIVEVKILGVISASFLSHTPISYPLAKSVDAPTQYWIGQKIRLNLAIRCYGKPEWTFWPTEHIKNLTIFHCPHWYIPAQDAIIPCPLTALLLPPVPSQTAQCHSQTELFVFLFIFMYISPMINF